MILNKGFIERRPDWTDALYQLCVLLILLCFSHSYCACSSVHTFLKGYGELVFGVVLKNASVCLFWIHGYSLKVTSMLLKEESLFQGHLKKNEDKNCNKLQIAVNKVVNKGSFRMRNLSP